MIMMVNGYQNTNAIDAQKKGYMQTTKCYDCILIEYCRNYFLGNPYKKRLCRLVGVYASQKIVDKFDMNVDPSEKMGTTIVALQAMVTINKISINDNIKLVILEEYTADWKMKKLKLYFNS